MKGKPQNVIDKAVDAYATPEAISQMVATRRAPGRGHVGEQDRRLRPLVQELRHQTAVIADRRQAEARC